MVLVVVAEWLRRWTRNPLGSPRAGSNPADYAGFLMQRRSGYDFFTRPWQVKDYKFYFKCLI